jgi:hypothetical protein
MQIFYICAIGFPDSGFAADCTLVLANKPNFLCSTRALAEANPLSGKSIVQCTVQKFSTCAVGFLALFRKEGGSAEPGDLNAGQ